MSATATVRPGRLASTWYATVHLLLWAVALALLVVIVVAIPLTLVTVGVVMLLVAVPLSGSFATANRWLAARVLGEPVEGHYVPTEGLRPLMRIMAWARDPQRWRDLGWLLVTTTVGFTLCLLVVTAFLSIIFYAIYPFLYWVTPAGVFDQDLGVLRIDTQAKSFLDWVFAALAFVIWWYAGPPLVRANARLDAALLSRGRTEALRRRVRDLSESRAQSVDFSAAELRRIERDLHDGAQARMVALGMSLGMADELMERDPDAARRLLAEARTTSSAALGDLRAVVRGIHPPVLADRGLSGAVQALAMDMSIPVHVTVDMAGRPPAPIESATYFAVAECLANVGKHSGASRAWVSLSHSDGTLRVEVGDDGRGGARSDPAAGTGILGMMRRLAAFDGTRAMSSPVGGPTLVVMEVPCALSSVKTTPSYGTD
jgi:signal transduction histidine kinase